MAVSKVFNGTTYTIPETGDSAWGDEVSNFLQAVADKALSLSGGTRELTADLNTGANFGLVAPYFKSRGSNLATAGILRLSNNESIGWRNAANGANKLLKVNASDVLEFDGNPVFTLALGAADTVLRMNAGGTAYEYAKVTNANVDAAAAIAYSKLSLSNSVVNADINSSAAIAYSKLNLSGSLLNADVNASAAIAYSKLNLAGSIVNADVNASAAIAYSKLNLGTSIVNADIATAAAIAYSKLAALTVSRALVSDGSGVVSVATTTATEIGYINGVTSAIQTQLNTKAAAGANSDITSLSALSTALSIAQGGTGQTAKTAAFDALAPTTTKGDLTAHDGTDNIRFAVGADGTVLTANSANPSGLGWAAPLTNPMDSAGDLIVGGALGAATKLDSGASGQLLMANGAAAPTWVDTITGAKTFSGAITRSGDTSVYAYDTADQAVTQATATIVFGTEAIDTLGEFSGNTFTAAAAGTYRVSVTGSLVRASGGALGGDAFQIRINKNGSLYGTYPQVSASVTDAWLPFANSVIVSLTAGQTITATLHNSIGGGRSFVGTIRGAAIAIDRV